MCERGGKEREEEENPRERKRKTNKAREENRRAYSDTNDLEKKNLFLVFSMRKLNLRCLSTLVPNPAGGAGSGVSSRLPSDGLTIHSFISGGGGGEKCDHHETPQTTTTIPPSSSSLLAKNNTLKKPKWLRVEKANISPEYEKLKTTLRGLKLNTVRVFCGGGFGYCLLQFEERGKCFLVAAVTFGSKECE